MKLSDVWRNATDSRYLLAIFFVSSILTIGAFYEDFASAEGGFEAGQIAMQESGAWRDLGLNPPYLEKHSNVTQAEIQLYDAAAGSANKTKYNRDLQESDWNAGEEWCANFVSWVYREAGLPFTGGESIGGWRYPSTGNLHTFLDNNATKINDPNQVKAGDIYWRDGHVGIVMGYNGSTYNVISGNTWGSDTWGGPNWSNTGQNRVRRHNEPTSVSVYRYPKVPETPKCDARRPGDCITLIIGDI